MNRGGYLWLMKPDTGVIMLVATSFFCICGGLGSLYLVMQNYFDSEDGFLELIALADQSLLNRELEKLAETLGGRKAPATENF